MFLPWHFVNEDKHMLDATTRTMLDALAGKLLRLADDHNDRGETATALLSTDAADALLVLLDHDGLRRTAGQGDAVRQ